MQAARTGSASPRPVSVATAGSALTLLARAGYVGDVSVADTVAPLVSAALGDRVPIRVTCWDGSKPSTAAG
jgi:hypothetical protein